MASCANIATAESAGPLTGVHAGNLVETPRGLRPLDLEGFSEDLDEDGQVDPLVSVQSAYLPPLKSVQSVTAPAAAAVATPFAHAVPAAAALPAAVGYVPQLGAPVTANYPYAVPAAHAATVAYPYAAPPPAVAHGVPAGYPYAASPVAHSVTYPYVSSSVHTHHPIPGHSHGYHLPLNTPYGHGLGYGGLGGVAHHGLVF